MIGCCVRRDIREEEVGNSQLRRYLDQKITSGLYLYEIVTYLTPNFEKEGGGRVALWFADIGIQIKSLCIIMFV